MQRKVVVKQGYEVQLHKVTRKLRAILVVFFHANSALLSCQWEEALTEKQAEETAYHICETVKSLTLPENLSGLVSCSIGGAFAPEEGTDYRELFKSADRRTYQAKRLGKNRFLMEDMDE